MSFAKSLTVIKCFECNLFPIDLVVKLHVSEDTLSLCHQQSKSFDYSSFLLPLAPFVEFSDFISLGFGSMSQLFDKSFLDFEASVVFKLFISSMLVLYLLDNFEPLFEDMVLHSMGILCLKQLLDFLGIILLLEDVGDEGFKTLGQ